MGSALAMPRMPSVPNSERVLADFKKTVPRNAGSTARLRLRLEAGGLAAAGGRHRGAASGRGRGGGRRLDRAAGVADDLFATDDAPDLVDREGLEFQQPLGQEMQLVNMRGQNLARRLLALLDDAANLVVDHLGGGVGDVLALGDGVAEEDLFLVLAVAQRAQLVAEAEFRDHAARQVGGAADVVGGAGGDLLGAEDHLLGDAAAEQARHHRFELHLRLAVFVAFGQEHGDAQRAAARDDGDLVQRFVAGDIEHDQGVAALVIGGQLLLVLGHDHGAALGAHHDLVLGLFELGHGDRALALARRHQRRLVDQIGEIGAGEARRAARDDARIDVGGERHLAHMHLENLLAADHVGIGHDHLAIEPPGAQQRRIEHVGPVGGGDQDNAFIGLEAVHLDQQLVEGLLALVVAAAEAGAAVTADGVDLVDEDDAGRVLLALLEHVAHARGADADEHLDEVGAGNGEERHVGLAGDGARQQRLAGAGRTAQQHALRNLAAEALEFLRVLEVLDDLLELVLGLVDAGDVVEGDAAHLFGEQARAALAEAHGAAAAALHLAHEEDPYADQQQHREPGNQNAEQRGHAVVIRRGVDDHALVEQTANQTRIVRDIGREGAAVAELAVDGAALAAALDGDFADLALADVGDEFGIGQAVLRGARGRALEQVEQSDQQQADDDPEGEVLAEIIHGAGPSMPRRIFLFPRVARDAAAPSAMPFHITT